MAAAGLAQQRPHDYVEPPIVTAGDDFDGVLALARASGGALPYPASAVLDYLVSGVV
jgi:hypothetical protein